MGEIYAGNNIQIDGNINIGHGPTGIKAMCRFDINTAYLTKAGKLTDNSSQHPAEIELPEDPARTIDTLIAEINEQGHKLEITASKYNANNINLESTIPGASANSIVFTKTGCLSTAAAGTVQTILQGSVTKGLDDGEASDWELHQNGYPVASRQSNNIYEGVQVFNNVVGFNNQVIVNGVTISDTRPFYDAYIKKSIGKDPSTWTPLDWFTMLSPLKGSIPMDLPFPEKLASYSTACYSFPQGNVNYKYLPDSWVFDELVQVGGAWYYSPFGGMTSLEELPASMTLSKFKYSFDSYGRYLNHAGLFQGCASLKHLPAGLLLENIIQGYSAFAGCKSLEDLPEGMTLSTLVNGGATNAYYDSGMFYNCTSLSRLPESLNLESLQTAYCMFQYCQLDGPSALRVITTIPTYEDPSTHYIHIGYKTKWVDNEEIAAILGTTTPIAAGTYTAKGWNITVQ